MMSKLSKEDLESLRRILEFEKRIEEIPENERVPVTNPRLTENVTVGMNAKGEWFPVHDASGRILTEEQALRRVRAREALAPDEIEHLRKTFTEEKMRALVETINQLWANENRSDEEDELLAQFEAYYEALNAPARG